MSLMPYRRLTRIVSTLRRIALHVARWRGRHDMYKESSTALVMCLSICLLGRKLDEDYQGGLG